MHQAVRRGEYGVERASLMMQPDELGMETLPCAGAAARIGLAAWLVGDDLGVR